MAVDWIPIRVRLEEDPAVVTVAARLKIGEDAIVGKLVKLWGWAQEHTTDGNARGVTEEFLDRYTGAPGMTQALIDVGWLERVEQPGTAIPAGIRFPKFERWNSQGAKRRALVAERVRKHRSGGNANGNAGSVTEALPQDRTGQDRRGQGKPPLPPCGGNATEAAPTVTIPPELDTPDFRAAWGEWKAERRAKRVKPYTPRGEAAQLIKLAGFGPAVAQDAIRQSIANGWAGLFPEKVATQQARPQAPQTARAAPLSAADVLARAAARAGNPNPSATEGAQS